jgi:transcriptional regulator with XRE-family HTH domain
MPTIDEVIGRRLRARREDMGRSAEEFASDLGITIGELYRIEAGLRRLGADLMGEACSVLDVLPTYFFDNADFDAGDGNDSGEREDDDDTGSRH